MREYDFYERLNFSFGIDTGTIENILKERISSVFAVQKADTEDDKSGVDYWVHRDFGLPPLAIDIKKRSKDYLDLKGKDDLFLETWSVCYSKIGWTCDPKKRADYIMWYWEPTGRFCIVPFPVLCQVFSFYKNQWMKTYKEKIQGSGSWKSAGIIVPRLVVFSKLNAAMNGHFDTESKKTVRNKELNNVFLLNQYKKTRHKKKLTKYNKLPLFDGLL